MDELEADAGEIPGHSLRVSAPAYAAGQIFDQCSPQVQSVVLSMLRFIVKTDCFRGGSRS